MATRATALPATPLTYEQAAGWLEEVLDFEEGKPFVLRPIDRSMLRLIVQLLKEAPMQDLSPLGEVADHVSDRYA